MSNNYFQYKPHIRFQMYGSILQILIVTQCHSYQTYKKTVHMPNDKP